jgi:hypothetical protein
MSSAGPAEYLSVLDAIDPPIDRSILDRDDLLIGRDGKLSVFYAPFDAINTEAKVVLLGLTPGWQQMEIAINAYCSARGAGRSDKRSQEAAKDLASFAGMRKRIATWLDLIGLQHRLGLDSAAQLFEAHSLLHTTSLIRYPTFVGDEHANYGGHSPKPEASTLLRQLISDVLSPELASVQNAMIVPMGVAVSNSLIRLKVTNIDRCLIGFPHPSGANGHGPKQFQANGSTMTKSVENWSVS